MPEDSENVVGTEDLFAREGLILLDGRKELGKTAMELLGKIYTSFESLPPAYVNLFARAGAGNFHLSVEWFRNFAAHAVEDREDIRIYVAERADGTPVAALPTRFSRTRDGIWSPTTLRGLSNFYTTLFSLIVDDSGPLPQILDILLKTVWTDPLRWEAVNLSPLDPDTPLYSALLGAFRRSGSVVQTYFCHGNWYLPVEGRLFEEYWQSLRSSVRNIAKSKLKKLERTGQARFELIQGGGELDAAEENYQRIYASSWKVPEPHPNFVPGLIRAFAERGWLRLGLAYWGNEPAAAQIWIVHNGTASIYKIAYDPKFAEFSIGTYLTVQMMKHVIDVEKVREVDYLSGDDRYKSDWMSVRREHWGILALNPRTARGALAIIRQLGGRALKRAWKRIQSPAATALPATVAEPQKRSA